MAVRLINLRHVPDDEADEVREVLQAHQIDFYETPPGRWGISAGGIWLRDKSQLPQARQLMADYQKQRQERARAEEPPPRKHPVQILIYLVIIGLILYFSIMPFMNLGG